MKVFSPITSVIGASLLFRIPTMAQSRELRTLLRLINRLTRKEAPLTEVPPIDAEHQQLRQEAIMAIAHLLQGLAKPHWVGPVLNWLCRFDGLEAVLYRDEDPVLATANTLANFVQAAHGQPQHVDAESLSRVLCDQAFCRLRARADKDAALEWDLAHETYLEFLTRIKPVVLPHIWEIDYTSASLIELKNVLKQTLIAAEIPPTAENSPED